MIARAQCPLVGVEDDRAVAAFLRWQTSRRTARDELVHLGDLSPYHRREASEAPACSLACSGSRMRRGYILIGRVRATNQDRT